MAVTGIQITGLKQTVRSLEKFGVEVSDLKAAFKKVAGAVADDSRGLINNRSGALAGSIRTGNSKNKAIVRAGSGRVPYAGVINFGGYHNIEGQHFLERAAQENESQSVRMIEEEIQNLIRSIGLN